MSIEDLEDIAQAMMAEGKGILAMDESHGTIGKRFGAVGLDCTAEMRRRYREMLLTTPNLGEHISGAILYDETLRQQSADGIAFPTLMREAGILPGIKVDTGAHPLAGYPGELITEGLDGLRARLAEYHALGARFAKWRAVITIGEDIPSSTCIDANTHALARYAALCQEQGLVPIVEPEILMDGEHDLEVSYDVTEAVLRSVFAALYEHSVLLEGTILKASMVIPGAGSGDPASVEDVADATIRCLRSTVPAVLPGIVFLSGGQNDHDATAHLDAMNRMGPHPWPLSFSYGRAMQQAALKLWSGDPDQAIEAAQACVFERARDNGHAATGSWAGGE